MDLEQNPRREARRWLPWRKCWPWLGLALAMPAWGTEGLRLPGHVPAITQQWAAVGRLAPTNLLHLAIGLAVRDQPGLEAFLRALQDPASPTYHHYLTPHQFAERFGPTPADYQALLDYARARHWTVLHKYSNRLLLSVAARADDVESALQVKLLTYRHPSDARLVYAPDVEPTVSRNLKWAHISGLDNFTRPHPQHHRDLAAHPQFSPQGSGPGGQLWGNDYRHAYVPGTTLTGAGQSMGFLEFETYYPVDLTNYVTAALGLPASQTPAVSIVPIGAGKVSPNEVGDNGEECSLDLEVAFAMAPGVTNLVIFVGTTNASFDDIFATMVEPAYTNILQFSCSWGGDTAADPTSEALFQQMQAQGQTFFNATGDNGAFAPGTATLPSDSPNITQVGGSALRVGAAPGYAWAGESAWDDVSGPSVAVASCVASGGGFSAYYPIPYWQTNLAYLQSTATNQASAAWRNFPDVSANGERNNEVYADNGRAESGWGGTSVAAPLWCGFAALLNQQQQILHPRSSQPVGFLNPALYALAQQPEAYTNYFHDTIGGNNLNRSSPGSYFCTSGYDLVCGIGTPMGTNLINALTARADDLQVLPLVVTVTNGLVAYGPVGGPFINGVQSCFLTNTGASALHWGILNTSVWLTAAPGAGELPGDTATNCIVSLAPAANGLPAGVYAASLQFTNQGGSAAAVPFTLQVGQSRLTNGSFETGDFTGWTLVGDTTFSGVVYNGVEDASFVTTLGGVNYVHGGNYAAVLGESGKLATLSQSVASQPGQRFCLSFWLFNPVSQPTEVFKVNWSAAGGGFANELYLVNPPAMGWTNFVLVVPSTGTNATLQFAAENDQDYFGLDDVSLTPIPAPSIIAFTGDAAQVGFSWFTVPGLTYRVQFATNLTQPVWNNLSTNVATGATAGYTNWNYSDPTRFYRIWQEP